MNKVGVLGGTFNPIHLGHLIIAQEALERLQLDAVIFIPSYWPPHKTKQNVIDAKYRLTMLKKAIKGNKKFLYDDFEIKQKGKSYTIQTIQHLRKKFPDVRSWNFIIGSDAVAGLDQWREIKTLTKLMNFVVCDRPGSTLKHSWIKLKHVPMLGVDISSTVIRRRIKQGLTVEYLLPKTVLKYIKKENLYLS